MHLIPGGTLTNHEPLVAKEIITLPKSVTPARIASNYQGALAAASKLTKEDIEKLDAVAASGKQKRYVMPAMPPSYIMLNFFESALLDSSCRHGPLTSDLRTGRDRTLKKRDIGY